MSNQNPKPKKPPKSKRINLNYKGQWREILKDVEKEQVPINLLDCIMLKLLDGTEITIEVKKMLDSGEDGEELQKDISAKLAKLDHLIDQVDFFISIESLDRIIKPITADILKDL
jgi:hypothetical protein